MTTGVFICPGWHMCRIGSSEAPPATGADNPEYDMCDHITLHKHRLDCDQTLHTCPVDGCCTEVSLKMGDDGVITVEEV